MLVFLCTNDHYEHLFNLQAAGFNRPLCWCQWHKTLTMPAFKCIWRIRTCCDVCLSRLFKSQAPLLRNNWCHVLFQCKRKFERDCKEADRAQQYFEKMDADINVTKADVEKVCPMRWPPITQARPGYPRCLTRFPGPTAPSHVAPRKDWVIMRLMPGTVRRIWHCLSSAVICCLTELIATLSSHYRSRAASKRSTAVLQGPLATEKTASELVCVYVCWGLHKWLCFAFSQPNQICSFGVSSDYTSRTINQHTRRSSVSQDS